VWSQGKDFVVGRIVGNPSTTGAPHQGFGSMPMRSLTAESNSLLAAKVAFGSLHRNVPKRNWICSNSPPMRGRAEHRSCGYAACGMSTGRVHDCVIRQEVN